jgi:hypothetical protein
MSVPRFDSQRFRGEQSLVSAPERSLIGLSPKRAANFFKVSFMELKCRGEISPAASRRLNSASTRSHSSIAAMLLARRFKMGDEKVHGLCDRFFIRSQLLGGSYCLYPMHWGRGRPEFREL